MLSVRMGAGAFDYHMGGRCVKGFMETTLYRCLGWEYFRYHPVTGNLLCGYRNPTNVCRIRAETEKPGDEMLNMTATDMQSYDGYLLTVHWFEGYIIVITGAPNEADPYKFCEWTWYDGGIRPRIERF